MARADREPAPIYRTWCPEAGQSMNKGYLELAAISSAEAARIHAERMTDRDWNRAKFGARGEPSCVKVHVLKGVGSPCVHTVRRRMEPVFEVVV